MNTWLHSSGDGITLSLHIQTGAKKTEFAGVHGDALKVRLHAQPIDGKANQALIDFVAQFLKVPKSCVCLKSGLSSRRKVLAIEGISTEAALQLLSSQC